MLITRISKKSLSEVVIKVVAGSCGEMEAPSGIIISTAVRRVTKKLHASLYASTDVCGASTGW